MAPGHVPEPRVSSNQWNDNASRQQQPPGLLGSRVTNDEDQRSSAPNARQQHRPQQPPSQQPVRVFRALFDYDPMTMSPNPDAASEELGLKEGELIKVSFGSTVANIILNETSIHLRDFLQMQVLGDTDNDGFYFGELDGRTGYIPHNMISEVLDQATVRDFLGATTADAGRANEERPLGARRKMVALYDYNPTEASPNVDADVG